MMKLAFWMNMPSFYQADLFRALSKIAGVELKVIFESRVPEDRARLGWHDDLDGFDYEFLDDRHPIIDAIRKARKYKGHVHIVNGLWAGRVMEAALASLFTLGSRYFIYSEAPDPRTTIPLYKKKLLTILGKQILKKAEGVLPISHFAVEYFKSYGVENLRICPFGYFRSLPDSFKDATIKPMKDSIDAIFVGQLVHRKGVDILLSAIEPLFASRKNLYLHLVGSGELEQECRNWVAQRNLSSQIIFEGVIDSTSILDRLAKSDLLVLPSRWDGWGVVVNEALMVGVPVIVSDMCGAADLIKNGVNGYVFKSEDVENLRDKLECFLARLESANNMSEEAKRVGIWLDARNAAEYLANALMGSGPDLNQPSKHPWVMKV
jgi:glycosyltransferase involved in cell wall biosynthesis